MTEEQKRLEKTLLEYIEHHAKDESIPPEIAETIPAAAEVLIKLWTNFG